MRAACGLLASEYHGTVKTGALPVPGVTVTAVQGGRKLVTTTDEHGVFSFADLTDGTWRLETEMLGFAKVTREVGVAHDAPPPELVLSILTEEALLARLEPTPAVPAAEAPAPAQAAAPAPARGTDARTDARAANAQTGGRGAANAPRAASFQRVNVNQSALSSTISTEATIKTEEIADLTQSAANSFIVQGSMSSAAGLPQMNDWGMGGRGMGPDGRAARAWEAPAWTVPAPMERQGLRRGWRADVEA